MDTVSKQEQYVMQIMSAIQTCFDGSSENSISVRELYEDDNLNLFFHALANIAPAMIYDRITGHETALLDFNHMANGLCFRYEQQVPADKEE